MAGTQRYLVDYPMAMLRAIAQGRGIELPAGRQAEVVGQLAAALLDPFSVRVALAQLSLEGRRAMDTLITAGGKMRAPRFGRRFGQVRPAGPGRLERESPWQKPATAAEELVYLGLAFRAFDRDTAGPGEFYLIPDDLLSLLPAPAGEPSRFAVEAVPAPALVRDAGHALVLDLFSYLVYLQSHDVRPYADGRLGRRDSAALRVRLSVADERRLAFLRHLAVRLGFVLPQGDILHLEAAPVKAWLAAPPAAQALALAEAWRDDSTWNDLRRLPGLAFDDDTGRPLRNDPVATRRALLALLARCPRESWWSAAAFVVAVRDHQPDFLRPDGDYGAWAVRDVASGEYLAGFDSWDRVEGALLADLLSGVLYWLGTVALDESGATCRLAETGARLLGLVEGEPEPLPQRPIQVGPDLLIEVPAPCNLYTRFQLERFADLERADPCRYRLTVSALGRALARGLRVEQVLAFLQQASEQRLPAEVPGALRLWAGRYDSVQLEEAVLVRVTGEQALKELQALPETRALIGPVLSPTTALVRREHLSRLRRELQALGYLRPAAEEDVASTPRAQSGP